MQIVYVGVIQKSFCTRFYTLYRSIPSMKTVHSFIFAVATMPMIVGAWFPYDATITHAGDFFLAEIGQTN